MKKLSIFLMCLFVALIGLTGCTESDREHPEIFGENVKNVVVLIGDGFGPNHLENAKRYFNIEKFDYEEDYVCDVTTYSRNKDITDSAAAATALATGKKVNNGEISRHKNVDLENLMEIAINNGKKTGIMSSDSLYGATPACYSAHANSRDLTDEIINDQMASGIDIFVGPRENGEYNCQGFADNGYNFIEDQSQLKQLDKEKKYIATFESLQSTYNENLTGQIDYPEAISDVLAYLDNEDGFCLMIENAYIDKNSHNNNFYGAMCEVRYFADMIDAVYKFCEGRDDTAVIVTADHETGGLKLGEGRFDNSLFTTTGHTATNVSLFIKYAYIEPTQTVDNTDIFAFCQQLIEKKNVVSQ